MKALTQILFLASFIAVSAPLGAQASMDTKAIKNVTAVEAQQVLQNDDIVILDIRTPQEYEASRIDGAININFYDRSFADQLKKLDKNKSYFVYCRSGNRTGQAMRIFNQLGFKDIYHLQRGVIDWTRSGYKMTK